MREFDLSAAKAGAAICTRIGRPARILCTDFADKLPIVAAVYFAGDKTEYIVYRSNDGTSTFSNADDLMMRDDNYADKLARGEYDNPQTHKIIRRADMATENEFEQFEELRGYIQEMACIGQIPADWTGFISCLNSALRSGFDPTRPKEGDSSVKESLTVENPTCKESLPVDREYWRRVSAGQAMMGIFAGRNWPKDGAPDCIEHARNAVELADALIAELEKNEQR